MPRRRRQRTAEQAQVEARLRALEEAAGIGDDHPGNGYVEVKQRVEQRLDRLCDVAQGRTA